MTPEAMLKKTSKLFSELKKAESMSVVVGLPRGKAAGKVYTLTAESRGAKEKNTTVLAVGAAHEYGVGNTPRRSFLHMPFVVKKKDMSRQIATQFKAVVASSFSAEKALGRVGYAARNIVLEAFKTGGFGQWPALSSKTVQEKGSSKILIDTGILRGSITSEVRG